MAIFFGVIYKQGGDIIKARKFREKARDLTRK